MKKVKPLKKTSKVSIEWVGECPICGREVKGNTESQVRWNIEVHLEKHRREVKKNDTS